ncbi:Neutral/alkaline non-lysosomal ceramidase-domain-containing protein [Mycena albidolilacea]|uniref:Neutral ceramidase n=1 Tax=Mycena albidolilacea TaxID=1033008 RepID=A0AAD7A7H6_9AGAR|nr:Neutral/alkaline non-lysosomal ceramidase-domain-containing protein [Mycena albidolilacea]
MKLDATLKNDAFSCAIQHHMKVHPEPEIKVETVDNNQRMKSKSACLSIITINSTTAGIIHVNFYDELDHKKTLSQVIVDDLPLQLSTTTNGGKKYSAFLSEFIPAAIRNDSPIKERSGHLYRPLSVMTLSTTTSLTFQFSEFELNFGDLRPSSDIFGNRRALRSSTPSSSFTTIPMHIPLLSSLFLSPLDALHSLSNQLVCALFASTPFVSQPVSGEYLLGLGIADITGPVVETNMMSDASLAQTATGLHMRQRAHAFIVAERASPANRILFINADIAMGDSGGTYHAGNVALVGTHQHSGVGGYLENLLPQITSRGLHPQTLSAILSGTLLATRRADASLAPGSLALGTGRVENGSINRSPTVYCANPVAERARYSDAGGEDGNQEWGVGVLRFGGAAEDEAERGFLSFFRVHGMSIYEDFTG